MSRSEPRFSILVDPAFLNFAARKAAFYSAKHNWFSDKLEIARWMARLDANSRGLAAELSSGQYEKGRVSVVPAPKKLVRTPHGVEYKTRYLAHVSFRDQVVFTAISILICEKWEAGWGNPEREDISQGSVWGNRIAINWNLNPVVFSFGSKKFYRDWADDYSSFVRSTEQTFNRSLEKLVRPQRLALLCVDIKSYYPTIDLFRLGKIIANRVADKRLSDFILEIFTPFACSYPLSDYKPFVQNGFLLGLPQGMVAGGFFANIYLDGFDSWVREKLASDLDLKNPSFLLYSRYVDDMRFIIRYEAGKGKPIVDTERHRLSRLIREKLGKEGLEVSKDKSVLVDVGQDGGRLTQGQLAERMRELRKRAYVPLTPEEGLSTAKDLRTLFATDTALPNAAQIDRDTQRLGVVLDGPGVRRESRRRFAAGWWKHLWGDQARFKLKDWDQERADFSDELLRAWLEDPGQLKLLKTALGLALEPKRIALIVRKLTEIQKDRFDWYEFIISDLFDHYTAKPDETAQIRSLALKHFAIRSLENGSTWFCRHKAAAFLCTQNLTGTDRVRLRHVKYSPQSDAENILMLCIGMRAEISRYTVAEFIAFYKMLSLPQRLSSNLLRIKVQAGRFDEIRASLSDLRKFFPTVVRELLQSPFLVQSEKRLEPLYRKLIRSSQDQQSVRWNPPKIHDSYLATAIMGGFYRHPLLHAQLVVSLLKLVKSKLQYERLAADGMLHPWNILVQPNLDLKFTDQLVPVSEYSGFPTGIKWLSDQHSKPPAWALPVGLVLRAAATGRFEHLFGMPYSARSSAWFDFSRLFRDGARLPQPAVEQIARLLARPGTIAIDRIDIDSELLAATKSLGQIRGVTILKNGLPPGASLLDVVAPINGGDSQRIAICQVDHSGTASMDEESQKIGRWIAVRRAFRMVREHQLHAGADKSINLVVFPELAVPWEALWDMVKFAAHDRIAVMCGMYFRDDPHIRGVRRNTLVWIVPVGVTDEFGRGPDRVVVLTQDKIHLTQKEIMAIPPVLAADPPVIWRINMGEGRRIAALNCYEFTDIDLRALVRGRVEGLVVSAENQDIATFDNLVESAHYDIYAHILLVNAGKYGGSTLRAPYRNRLERRIFDIHGGALFSVNLREVQLQNALVSGKFKTRPAGFKRHS